MPSPSPAQVQYATAPSAASFDAAFSRTTSPAEAKAGALQLADLRARRGEGGAVAASDHYA